VRPVFGDALNARLAHYLLSPNLIPMLEERLAGK
jgi:hypothetical protein